MENASDWLKTTGQIVMMAQIDQLEASRLILETSRL
jgi:hypothetical protein